MKNKWYLALIICFVLAPSAFSQNAWWVNKVPGQLESKAQQLTYLLHTQGYEVLRGYFKLYTNADCDLSYWVMHTCYANNPAAPYVLPIVPPWPGQRGPGEWVDPATKGAFGKTLYGYNASHRFDPREALIILAQMPPPASYFGQQTYLFTRAGELHTNSSQYQWINKNIPYMLPVFFGLVPHEPQNAHRVEIMADVSDSNNNAVIANKSGNFWNQFRYFIVTPNPAMDSAVRKLFANIGVADNAVFTEKIPNHLLELPVPPPVPDDTAVRFGLHQQADDFVTVIRYAMPVDESSADRWRQDLPLVVLRVRNLGAENQTYQWPGFEKRTPSQPPETWYDDQPQNYLTSLATAICAMWNQPGCETTPFLNLQLRPFKLTGPECLVAWMNCLAPGEDSSYLMSGKLPLDADHVYAIVGPLSTATNNATYVGLGLNSSVKQLGFDNISGDKLAGSAYGYTSAIPSEMFFVQYFARDCTGLRDRLPSDVTFNCYPIGDKLPWCQDKTDPGCDMLNLSLRGYIRPTTQRATDPASVLSTRFIVLKR